MNSTLKPPFVLALDVGTSSTRALLFDANGTAVPHVVSQRPYALTVFSSRRGFGECRCAGYPGGRDY
jgi:glycerol kinase